MLFALTSAGLMGATPGGEAVAVSPELINRALAAYERHGEDSDLRHDVIVIVDLAAHSSKPRFHILDLGTGEIASHLTTHGRGSDQDADGYADAFSNVEGSLATSVGGYRTAELYYGRWGLSLRLDGLDESNEAARQRAIVIHAADYVSPNYVDENGKPGRSEGCFALSPDKNQDIIKQIANGTFLYAAAPNLARTQVAAAPRFVTAIADPEAMGDYPVTTTTVSTTLVNDGGATVAE